MKTNGSSVKHRHAGTLSQEAQTGRDVVEEAIAICLATKRDISEINIRMNQAVRRTPLVEPVLLPAIERMEEVACRIDKMRADLGAYWKTGQARRWQG